MLAPEIVEIGHQRRDVGHGRMQVAIDGAGKGKLHRMPRAQCPEEGLQTYAPARFGAKQRGLFAR
jgi:hypothetical protein